MLVSAEEVLRLIDKRDRYKQALERIRDFGHAADCPGFAPLYECCCFEKDQAAIAREALEQKP